MSECSGHCKRMLCSVVTLIPGHLKIQDIFKKQTQETAISNYIGTNQPISGKHECMAALAILIFLIIYFEAGNLQPSSQV